MRLYHLTNPLVIASDSTLWLVIHLENSATPISFKWVAIVCAHQLLNAVFFFTSKCLWNSAKMTNSSTAFHSHLSSSSHSSISCHHPSTSEFSPPESQRKMKRNTNAPYVPSLTCIKINIYPSVTDHYRLGILTLHDTAPNHLRRKTPFVRRSERRENSNSLVSMCYWCILPYMSIGVGSGILDMEPWLHYKWKWTVNILERNFGNN